MKEVILYGMDTCPHCKQAKNFLQENKVDFVYKNVKEDPEARKEFVSKGHTGVPVILVGDEEILGFDRQKLESLLNI